MSERDMNTLLELVARHLGTEWLGISDWLRDQNSVDEIESRIRANDWAGAVQAIQDAALRWAAETHGAYTQAGDTAARWLDDQPATADSLVRFDVTQPAVIERAKQNQLEMVSGFQDEANQIARQITQRALTQGTVDSLNPRAIAQQFRDSIGLAPNQEQWMANYRQALEQGDYRRALGYELSSGHSDRTIAAVANYNDALTAEDIAAGRRPRSLTSDQIDTAVERYRQNALTYRAENIARTETGKNVHQGVTDAFDQAIARGDIEADQLQKEWLHSGLELHPRPAHQAADGQTVGFRETFDIGGVRMRFPHDPEAPVREVAGCACTFATTIK